MKNHLENHAIPRMQLLSIALAAFLSLPLSSLAAPVSLATAPLATTSTTNIQPNLMLVLDNSGSMDWDHMPDDSSDGGSSVTFNYGYYGLRSNQCNQVYYNPATTYKPPVDAAVASYANSTFTNAWVNGFSTGSGTTNLQTSYIASQSLNADSAGSTAYYYNYSGVQTTTLQKNYNSTTNTFYSECNSAQYVAPGTNVFTKIVLSNAAAATTATIVVSGTSSTSVSSIKLNGVELMSGATAADTSSSGLATKIAAKITLGGVSASVAGSTVTLTGLADTSNSLIVTQSGTMTLARTIYPKTDATKLTNFANWYSYYRTRMLMMKTATGLAFSDLGIGQRVGLMKISASTSPTVLVDTFTGTQRSNWYTQLYATAVSGSTPLRTALSNAGRYFAGKLGVTDPIQFSCQQNFAILSTDGYWNAGDDVNLAGTSNSLGNQDGTAGRPMYDGAQTQTQYTFTYTRDNYTKVTDTCSSGKKKLKDQPEIGTCVKTVNTGSCTPTNWVNNGAFILGTTCNNTSAPSPSTPVLQGIVATPGTSGGSSDSLADVAMYYYQTDLRTPALANCGTPATTGPLCENNVFISSNDNNTQQHMTTFTLGLGASGWMTYSPSYLTDTSGDYVAVKLGSTANSAAVPPVCSWQANGTTCNWPLPGMSGSDGLIANVDDLWHAAVNGHGAYFSATDATSLSTGLSNALSGISERKGAAAAAATSTLNPVAGNNYAFVASYTTVAWKGNLEARSINIDTGVVSQNATWCAENVVADTCASPSTIVAETTGSTTIYNCVTPNSVICTNGTLVGTDCKVPVATTCTGTMNAKVADMTDTRTIKTANSAGGLTNFDAAYAAANPTNFSTAHISTLSQWTSLTAAQKTMATGANLVNFLRGQHGYEDRTTNTDRIYRYREAVLGDALESQPAYMAAPVFSYPYAGYSNYVTAQSARAGAVYMGANDGMLHAFDATTGIENWAYVPSMVVSNMWKLADQNYDIMHSNFVNGSPITSDICAANCTDPATAVWKTILVGGLNGGGRGYYALDITDPATPQLLWEFTTTAGFGTTKDDDIGYGFGQAIMTTKTDGTWVVLVTSGYNNTSPGSGGGFLFVLNANTGAIISKIPTGVTGSSGLSRIAAWNDEPSGNKAGPVYGGDLAGNLWRFDINANTVMKFAQLTDGTNPQPITTTPVLGTISSKRVVFVGTGKYLEASDLTDTKKQSIYAIQDNNETTTLVNPRSVLVQQTLTNNGATRTTSGATVDFNLVRGWFIDLPDSGERVNIDSMLVQGTLLVPSIVPSNTACSPGGYGWLNFLDYKTGGAVEPLTNSTGSLKYDSPIVGINLLFVQGKAKVAVVTSAVATPKLNDAVTFGGAIPGFTGKKVLWRELIP